MRAAPRAGRHDCSDLHRHLETRLNPRKANSRPGQPMRCTDNELSPSPDVRHLAQETEGLAAVATGLDAKHRLGCRAVHDQVLGVAVRPGLGDQRVTVCLWCSRPRATSWPATMIEPSPRHFRSHPSRTCPHLSAPGQRSQSI